MADTWEAGKDEYAIMQDLISKNHPHLALVDIGLPGLTGYEVARQARERGHVAGGEAALRTAGHASAGRTAPAPARGSVVAAGPASDARNRVTDTYVLNFVDDPISNPPSAPRNIRTSHVEYYANGKQKNVTDTAGTTTSFTYTADGLLVSTTLSQCSCMTMCICIVRSRPRNANLCDRVRAVPITSNSMRSSSVLRYVGASLKA